MEKNRRFYLLVLLALFALVFSGCSWFDDDDDDNSNTAGTLDTSFGDSGKAVTELGQFAEGYGMALQSDGKIVVAGELEAAPLALGAAGTKGLTYEFMLARFNADGTLDDTFGDGGIVTTSLGDGTYSEAYGVALQDDKIIAVGYAYNGSDDDLAVVRYTSDGTLDDTFGDGGVVLTDVDGYDSEAYGVAIDANDKIVVCGYTETATYNQFIVARYDGDDGDLDTTFGDGGAGYAITPFDGNSTGFALAIQPYDGMIVVAGESYNGSNWEAAVVRYDTDGVLDENFGEGGGRLISPSSDDCYAYAVVIQEDGKIVLGGEVDVSSDVISNARFALGRLEADGSYDDTFGDGGFVLTTIGSYAYVYGLAIQEDGKIVAVGYADMDDDSSRFAVARYDTDGSLDRSFGRGGIVTTSFTGDDDEAYAVTIDPADDSIIVVGYAYDGDENMSNFAVARYQP